MTTALRTRHGVALVAALGLMAVMGLLIGGAVASAAFAERAAGAWRAGAVLDAAADFALGAALSDARSLDVASQPLGRPMRVASYSNSDANVVVSATRFAQGVAWLVADARDARAGAGGARRRVNLVARWRVPAALPRAGLVARGNVRLGPTVAFSREIAGDDDCRASPGADVVVGAGSSVVGLDSTRAMRDSASSGLGAYDADAPWRAQLDSAERTASVVHARGDTTIADGALDGVLLVDGTLRVTGTFTVSGLVVAGAVDARGGSIGIIGALLSLAPSPVGDYAVDLSNAMIRYSACTVARALRRGLPLRPVRGRSWAELF